MLLNRVRLAFWIISQYHKDINASSSFPVNFKINFIHKNTISKYKLPRVIHFNIKHLKTLPIIQKNCIRTKLRSKT